MQNQRDEILRAVRRLHECSRAKEDAVIVEQQIALRDASVRSFVEMFYFDTDREASLQRFLTSDFTADVVSTIRHHFGDRKDMAICEIGAGNGFLAAALVRAGYTDVDIVEPSTEYATGTGFVRLKPEYSGITIHSDLDDWYASDKLYDLVISNACIHHFDNPAVVAAQIRLKMRDRAPWLAFTEFFAVDYEDTLTQLNSHRHAVLYGLYEWPYSAELYAVMLKASGFDRREIAPLIPYGRRKLSRRGVLLRTAWRLACVTGMSGPAYSLWRAVVARSRRHLRYADANYMLFIARPIRWEVVEHGYNMLQEDSEVRALSR